MLVASTLKTEILLNTCKLAAKLMNELPFSLCDGLLRRLVTAGIDARYEVCERHSRANVHDYENGNKAVPAWHVIVLSS